MKNTKREKKIIAVAAIIILGVAFLFFVLGIIFTTHAHVKLLGSIKVDEINIDLNESIMVDLAYKLQKEQQELRIKQRG